MKTSFVIPYYRRLPWLRLALPHNLPVYSQPNVEVILVLDDDHEKDLVLKEIQKYPVNWRVVLMKDERPREYPPMVTTISFPKWRPPCKAINVGIRLAKGENVAVLSPETVIVTETPEFYTRTIGNSNYLTGLLWDGANLPGFEDFHTFMIEPLGGFLMTHKSNFELIHGYDESRNKWGRDDSDIRWRLQRSGVIGVVDYRIRMMHFSHGNELRVPPSECEPMKVELNQPDWGKTPNEVLI